MSEKLDTAIYLRISSEQKQKFLDTLDKLTRSIPGAKLDYAEVVRGMIDEFIKKHGGDVK